MELKNNSDNPYGSSLAANINAIRPDITASYSYGQILIHKTGADDDLQAWLYSLLESLPEIDAPLERIEFIIKENGFISLLKVINPSEFDITAIDKAVGRGLNFSGVASGDWNKPMPLDHPWYSDKDYFKKLPKKKDPLSFDSLKDLPNVKPILDKLREDGIDI